MSTPHKCGSSRRQLPSTPSCQCHALLSYKLRPQPVFRPEAPEESLKELMDDIFRMGTAYLIRSGERISPAEMAYFECLNEMGVPECIAPPQLQMDQRFNPLAGVLDGGAKGKAPLEDVVNADATHGTEQTEELGSVEPQKSESDPVTTESRPTVEQGEVPLTAKKTTSATAQKLPSPIVRYITEDQLGTMGWKDLFKLARVRKVVHGPMMRSRQELVRRFVEKYGGEVPVYEEDRLPKEFPSRHSSECSVVRDEALLTAATMISGEMGVWPGREIRSCIAAD